MLEQKEAEADVGLTNEQTNLNKILDGVDACIDLFISSREVLAKYRNGDT